MKLTPEHKLLCDAAAMSAHLDKYSRIEQRKLLSRVIDHLRAVVEAQAHPPAHHQVTKDTEASQS
jgi:hypothetical protein